MEIPDSDEGNVGVTTSESPAEVAVVRIVSNLPAASREAGNEPQAASSDRARTHHEEMDCWTDEDGDDEDIDIDELEDDMAELEEELDHGAWDGVPGPPAGFPDYVHEDQEGEEEEDQLEHQLFGDDEPPAMDFGPFYGGMLDPDVDVGLYGEEDDDYELYDDEDNEEDEDDFDDDEEGWDVQLGHEGAVDNFQMNLHEFRFAVQDRVSSQQHVPIFWGQIHDESEDGFLEPDTKEEDNPEQESFFSRVGQQESQWFHLGAASNHFQSADSLSTAGTPSSSFIAGSQDEEIVMLHNTFCLGLWRLPASSSTALSASSSAATSASILAASRPPLQAAPALSSSATASASAALPGFVPTAASAAHTASPLAALPAGASASGAAPTAAAARIRSFAGVNTAAPEEEDAQLLAFAYPRFRVYSIARSPDGKIIAVGGHAGLVSIYKVVPNPDHDPSHTPAAPPGTPATSAPADNPQLRAHVMCSNTTSVHMNKCPLVMQLVTHIALESLSHMVKADTMANSVRFGSVGGKTRLLVACQNKLVYVFEVGSGCVESASKEMPCQQIHAGTQEEMEDNCQELRWRRSAEVLFMSDNQLLDMRHMAMTNPTPDAAWDSLSSPARTSVIGSSGAPCNCATASPDGDWVAVVGDAPLLHLLHISEGYSTQKPLQGAAHGKRKSAVLTFGAKKPQRTSRSQPRRAGTEAGSQYCCWNRDSSLVAVSSDYFQAVMVFDVHRKQQVIRFEDQPSACLAVTFAPWDPQLLVFAEAVHRIYITDLRNVSHARQRLILCSNKEDDPVLDLEEDYVSSDHIRGLSVTPGGRLLVAHSGRLVQWNFLRNWAPEEHRHYPARLREVTKLLLMAAASSGGSVSPADKGSEFGLHSLPKEVLLKILGMAALPLGTWMTGLPQIKSTEGLPEKPLPLETLKQHQHARNN